LTFGIVDTTRTIIYVALTFVICAPLLNVPLFMHVMENSLRPVTSLDGVALFASRVFQTVTNALLRSAFAGVIFHFGHDDFLLLVVENVTTSRSATACNVAMLRLRPATHHFTRTARTADSASRNLISILGRVEVAIVMQRLATVARALWIAVRCFVADMLAELGNASWMSAA
jgi:hypothetical protein